MREKYGLKERKSHFPPQSRLVTELNHLPTLQCRRHYQLLITCLWAEKFQIRWQGKIFRRLDRRAMEIFARDKLSELGLLTIQKYKSSGGNTIRRQRQGAAVAAFGSKVIFWMNPQQHWV